MELHCIAQREGKLSTFLHRELRCSSSFINKNKWLQGFYVNGVSQRTNYMVQPGDEIRVPIIEPKPEYPAQYEPLEILYEDEAVIAIDKPVGLLMHPSFHRITDTLANYLVGYYEQTGQPCAVHPVSRLDRDTFGVVLLAKNAYTHAILFEDMKEGRIHKTYHALTWGCPEAESGVIDAPIGRLPKPSLLRQVDPKGQRAVSKYRILEEADGCAHLELQPITGRTHQLRVHCAYIGCPILGDPQYGNEAARAESVRRELHHQQLCAVSLTFPHPMTGEEMTVRSRQTVHL